MLDKNVHGDDKPEVLQSKFRKMSRRRWRTPSAANGASFDLGRCGAHVRVTVGVSVRWRTLYEEYFIIHRADSPNLSVKLAAKHRYTGRRRAREFYGGNDSRRRWRSWRKTFS